MRITNKVFLDSSFSTEGFKGTHPDFYRFFDTAPGLECCINAIACSEHWCHLIGLIGSTSPLTLKTGNEIAATVSKDIPRFEFFRDFAIVSTEADTFEPALVCRKKHSLLSNDALILAGCVAPNIPFIAGHDSDFENACKTEGITLATPNNYLQPFPQS